MGAAVSASLSVSVSDASSAFSSVLNLNLSEQLCTPCFMVEPLRKVLTYLSFRAFRLVTRRCIRLCFANTSPPLVYDVDCALAFAVTFVVTVVVLEDCPTAAY